MAILLMPRRPISAGSIDLLRVDLQNHLDAEETLIGAPTFTNIASVISFASPQINSEEITIDRRKSPPGKAAFATGTVAATDGEYDVQFSVSTSSGRNLKFRLPIDVQ